MQGSIVALVQKLEDVHFIQEISRIHIVADDFCGCCHPGTAVKTGPGAGIPVVGSVRQRFIRRNTVGMYQITSENTFVLNHSIPVQPGLDCRKGPVRILRMDLTQSFLIRFREPLCGEL